MNSTFSFQDDSPLSKQKAGNKTVSSLDRFGRTTLIRNLAQAISASVSKNGSLVVSLEGPWGSGKTSAKKYAGGITHRMLGEQEKTLK